MITTAIFGQKKTLRAPGPRGNLLLGSMFDFARDLNGFMLRTSRDYGPIARFRMVHRQAFLVSSPELNEYVLLGNYKNFLKHQLFFDRVRPVFGWGLLSNDGDSWRKQRRLSAPAFHRDRITDYGKVMTEYARDQMKTWKDGETVDMYLQMRSVAAKIVARALFDDVIAGDVDQISEAMDQLLDAITERMLNPLVAPDWLPTPGVRRYRKSVEAIDALIHRFIEDHRANLDQRHTLLAMLMSARDEDGKPMSDQMLRDEAATLFLAGHDTTATALTWATYLMTQFPAWQQKLQEVVDQFDRPIEAADMAKIPELDWTIRESLRLYPSITIIARQSVADCEIGGYPIPAKSLVYVSPYAMHRNPKYFPEPDRFNPERWAGGMESKLPRHVFIPFSGGPRICIGERFAMMEAILLLANFLQEYTFEYGGAKPPIPFASITLIPKTGMPIRLRKRNKPAAKAPTSEATAAPAEAGM
jgi:cytochrome P450